MAKSLGYHTGTSIGQWRVKSIILYLILHKSEGLELFFAALVSEM